MLAARTINRFSLLILLAGVSCLDQGVTRDYPQVATTQVTDITLSGATFHSSFDASFLDKVNDHGFVWGPGDKPSVETSAFLRLGKPTSPEFSAGAKSQLFAGTYNVRAFAQVNTRKVYGPKITFVSLGSEGPKIDDFNPKTGKSKDLILITGRNFSERISENTVLFETSTSTYAAVVRKASATELEIEVPQFYIKTSFLSVSIPGQKNKTTTPFHLNNVPDVTAIAPSVLRMCDTLTIRGTDLISLGSPVILLKNNVTTAHSISASEIKIVMKQILTNPLDITLKYPQLEINQTLGNAFSAPNVLSVSVDAVAVNDLITISGNNLPRCELTILTSTEAELITQSVSLSKIELRVQSTGCSPFQIALEVKGNRFFLSDPIAVSSDDFTVLEISPPTGTMGDLISITGTGLDNVQFFIGGAQAFIAARQEDLVAIEVPGDAYSSDSDGNTTLTISSCLNMVDFPFTLKRPEIIDFSPKKVTVETQTVTIDGNNLSSFTTEIWLENPQTAYQVFDFNFSPQASKTFGIEGVFPPGSIDSYNIRIWTAGMEVISASTIEIDLYPQIVEFLPASVTDPNETITIHGRNFLPFGGNSVTLENDSETLIVTTIIYEDNQQISFSIADLVSPGFTGEFFIKVEVNGSVAISQEKILINIP